MATKELEDARALALKFTRALATRDYAAGYGMTSTAYRGRVPLQAMRGDFEAMIPDDWGEVEPIEVEQAAERWPGKEPDDVGWLYVSIYGDVYSEALIVVVAEEAGELRVRSVELGRP